MVSTCSREVGVRVSDSELNLDARPLLSLVLSRMLGGAAGFTSMCVEHLPSPVTQAPSKVQLTYTGAQTSAEATAMSAVDGKGPLVCQTVKVYARSDGKTHDVFARVLSGTIKVWDQVRVLGPGYTPQNTEDSCVCEVNQLWVFNGRYRVMVNQVSAGNWVLIGGIDNGVTKTATIVSADDAPEDVCVFTPLVFNTRSTFKVAIEPVVPAELPKMLTGIRHINKTYVSVCMCSI
jgi:U5 small nuclear ribonucleoprotein component